jgi:S-adenosylmethionine:tRNA ribosyltransferase-isomerase
MRPPDFDYHLPEAQIAQAPLPERADSRLLQLTPDGACVDLAFKALSQLVQPGDRLVFNDTRVLPARAFGSKASGGRLELLLERILKEDLALVQIKASKAPRPGSTLQLAGGAVGQVLDRDQGFFQVRLDQPWLTYLEQHGHMPLPPYIQRSAQPEDRQRYQTVFARHPGAVAAPTAGLHFDEGQLNHLRSRGVDVSYLTLHVGAGTFQPLRDEQLASGQLHPEHLEFSRQLCEEIAETQSLGGRIVAVGTTVMRGLETAAATGELLPFSGETRLFIRPGYRFQVADALLTNFHLPRSSLLMLVCAFAGSAEVMAAYRHAVAANYRFFSYGDAMFCERSGVV